MGQVALPIVGILILTAACGARTVPLDAQGNAAQEPQPDSGADSSLPPQHDAGPDVDAAPVMPDGSPCLCDDGVPCTIDKCDPLTMQCVHTPDDTQCPSGELCSATRGCATFVYADTDSNLYEVDVPSGRLLDLGTFAVAGGDLALAPDGTLYTFDITGATLYTVNRADATARAVATLASPDQLNGLGSRPDGTLAGGSGSANAIDAISPATGVATPIASLPAGYVTSGDLSSASAGSAGVELFVTTTGSGGASTDWLAVVSSGGGVVLVGDIGINCVWGLATLGDTLYGLTCNGQVVAIDKGTGVGTAMGQTQASFFGAAGR